MTDISPIQRFFQSYERDGDQDPSTLASHFADTFLAAGPQGARCVPAGVFAPAVAARKQLFDRLGCHRPDLISLAESPINTRYVLARTQWRFVFAPPQVQPETITVESTFLIDTGTDPFKILVYLAHQDIMAILSDRGLLARAPGSPGVVDLSAAPLS